MRSAEMPHPGMVEDRIGASQDASEWTASGGGPRSDRTKKREKTWSRRGLVRRRAALVLVVYEIIVARGRDRAGCFKAFMHNHWVGMVVIAGFELDFALGK